MNDINEKKICLICGDPVSHKMMDYCRSCKCAIDDTNLPLHPKLDIIKLSNLHKEKYKMIELSGIQYQVSSILSKKEGGLKHQDNMFITPRRGNKQKHIDEYVLNNPGIIEHLKVLFEDSTSIICAHTEEKTAAKILADKIYHAECVLRLSETRAQKTQSIHPEYDKKKAFDIYYESIEKGSDYCVDHIVPLSKRGWHHHDNLQVITNDINVEKGSSLTYTHPDIKHWSSLPFKLWPLEWQHKMLDNYSSELERFKTEWIKSEQFQEYIKQPQQALSVDYRKGR